MDGWGVWGERVILGVEVAVGGRLGCTYVYGGFCLDGYEWRVGLAIIVSEFLIFWSVGVCGTTGKNKRAIKKIVLFDQCVN